ncbi:MAG: GIY-YIG nuclease family protein [Flavobacteriales bacterium]|nr:GIY-YIG nuclease family protein [Flavobacteriales bacterium]
MFAIVDIETTGGRPGKDGITEIAIVLHDGEKVVSTFSTLINPFRNIPYQITRITGIDNEMVQDAPGFHEVAKEIVELTEGAVFVAHNVNFDYAFLKQAFLELGYTYQRKTMCTVRLSRITFPGFPSYSLGNLCEKLGIEITNRHRALGDAMATAILFDRILKLNPGLQNGKEREKIAKKSKIPPNLDQKILQDIPEGITGVYYFHDGKGEIIYVGKSNDIRKRLNQHFAFKVKDSEKALMMKETLADISYVNTGSELVALLLESDEIKKVKPIFNHAQKRTRLIPFYGIFSFYDQNNYLRLTIQRLKNSDRPLRLVDNMMSARNLLTRLIRQFGLCSAKCDMHHTGGPCFDYQLHKCDGACIGEETSEVYNRKVEEAIESISFMNESFFILDKGRNIHEKSVVFIEKGQYKGFGFVEANSETDLQETLLNSIKPYSHNSDIQTILCTYLKKEHIKIPYKERVDA